MVAVETGAVLPLAAGVDGVEDGVEDDVAVAAESCVGTDESKRDMRSHSRKSFWSFGLFSTATHFHCVNVDINVFKLNGR